MYVLNVHTCTYQMYLNSIFFLVFQFITFLLVLLYQLFYQVLPLYLCRLLLTWSHYCRETWQDYNRVHLAYSQLLFRFLLTLLALQSTLFSVQQSLVSSILRPFWCYRAFSKRIFWKAVKNFISTTKRKLFASMLEYLPVGSRKIKTMFIDG